MKRTGFLLLTALLLLTGIAGAAELPVSPYTDKDFHVNQKITITSEYPYYDYLWYQPTFEWIDYRVAHWSDSMPKFTFTDVFTVEMEKDGQWYVLPYSDKADFLNAAISLRYGQEWKSRIMPDWFDHDWAPGEYRLVMIINDKPRQMPFRIDYYPETSELGLWPTLHAEEDFGTGQVKLIPQEGGYAQGEKEMAYTIENTGTRSALYGEMYEVEMRENGKWYRIPFTYAYWNAVGHLLYVDQSETLAIETSDFTFDFPAGEYRLIKEFGDTLYTMEFTIHK